MAGTHWVQRPVVVLERAAKYLCVCGGLCLYI